MTQSPATTPRSSKTPLPARKSSLQTSKLTNAPSSTISHLHALFQDNLQYDPLRCLQGWRLLCEEEWNGTKAPDASPGFNMRDICPEMKQWLGMVIKGVYLYDETEENRTRDSADSKQLTTEERIEKSLSGTRRLLKKSLQRQQQENGATDDSLMTSHLISETALFRNMSGEKFLSKSLKASLRRSVRQQEVATGSSLEPEADIASSIDEDRHDEEVEGEFESEQQHDVEGEESSSQSPGAVSEENGELQTTAQFETHIIREDTNLLNNADYNDEDSQQDREEPSILREIADELVIDASTQFAAFIVPQKETSDSDSDDETTTHPVQTANNPFYQILKEFIELACVPLQMNKSSDVLLKNRKYAELLDILGFLSMNCIQWDTLAVRCMRAIRHIFYTCTTSISAPEGSLAAQIEQTKEQNALLAQSKLAFYIYYSLLLFQKYSLGADSSNVVSSTLESILSPKTMDVLSEMLFLLKDFSPLTEGAQIISSNQMLIPLMEFIDMTAIVREENAPLYLHTLVEIVWNTMMSISNYEQTLEQVSTSMDLSFQNGAATTNGVFTLSALRKKRSKLPPLQQSTESRPLPHTDDSNAPLISFHTQHTITMDPSNVISLLSSLLSLFRDLLQNATKQTDHYLKNDILVICSLFASNPEYKPLFREIGFIEDVCLFFQKEVSEEQHMTSRSSALTNGMDTLGSPQINKYSPPHYSSEMIVLLWHLLNSLAFDHDSLEIMLQEGVLAIILNYVDLTCNDLYCISKWSEDQLKDLRLQALQSLFFFSELSPEAFCANAGCETLLELLSFLNQHDFENANSSFQVDEDVDILMQKITAVLLNASTTSQGSLELTQKGGFGFLFELAANHDEPMTDNIPSFIQRRNDCFEILMWMCKNNPENQMTFYESGGVSKLLLLLNEYNNHTGACSSLLTQQENDDFLFQLVNCLWTCVVGYDLSEKAFNQEHGVFVLLDVMDNSASFVQYSVLGFIGDMVAFPDARQQLSQWVSRRTKRTAVETLAQMWEQESDAPNDTLIETKFGCKRSELDFKLKIHTILAQLQFKDHHPRKSISHMEKLTLAEIASYGELRKNKVWAAVASELDAEGVRPISPDSGVLREKNMHLMQLEESVQAKKLSIRDKLQQHDKEKESEFFDYIRTLVEDQQKERELKSRKVSILEQKRLKDKLFRQARSQQV
mmetsp:Transcript_1868/g.6621  ORF Transcript_1868/g.6621 Transcript_1868/m.6621 type:complete len:1183 (-) Transcript_1868:163-3711(-)|eukprot:CAMPEP_0117443280 /NCGR_PEP_ID=MMETSP0759-20121206/4610_1 /TAXON_ID=63605 /ORGANISM="Percolomonas cosmopolitus, Strain WS" /LENGTH=1182 /DNA_ID=CAMNT_0005235243 /DNA_START=140 /DNA_END=3688 /DNA_ORIENTATION=-